VELGPVGRSDGGEASSVVQLVAEKEKDPKRLKQRAKQIKFGKNTIGYDRYVSAVPRKQRRRGQLRTPDPTLKVRREEKGQV
jgi:histone RNA hairpin-binding protein